MGLTFKDKIKGNYGENAQGSSSGSDIVRKYKFRRAGFGFKQVLIYIGIVLIVYLLLGTLIGTLFFKLGNLFVVDKPRWTLLRALGYLGQLWWVPLLVSIVVGYVLMIFLSAWLPIFDKPDTYSDEQKVTYKTDDGSYGVRRRLSENDPEILECLNNEPIDSINSQGDIIGASAVSDNVLTVKPKMPNKRNPLANSHMCINGPSGSGKTRCIVFTKIFQAIRRGESFVCTDTSGELFRETKYIAEQNGYEVRLLDYRMYMAFHSDSFNPIAQVVHGDPAQAMTLAGLISDAASPNHDFWYETSKSVLTALILYVDSMPCDVEEKTLGRVYQLCCKGSTSLSTELGSIPAGHPAYESAQKFINSDPKVKDGAIAGITNLLYVFGEETIRRITSYNDVNLKDPGNKRCAYYVTLSESQSTLEFMSSIFFSFLFDSLSELANTTYKNGKTGELRVPVNIIMDEFVSIGTIDDFVKKLANVRKYGINITIIFQDLPQLEENYGGTSGNIWLSIPSNCAINILLACNEPEKTAAYYSKMAGVGTIESKSDAVQRNVLNAGMPHLSFREQNTVMERNIFNVDEITGLKVDELFVNIAAHGSVVLKKYDYTNHPMYKQVIPQNPLDYEPAWWQNAPEYKDRKSELIAEAERQQKEYEEEKKRYESIGSAMEERDYSKVSSVKPKAWKSVNKLIKKPKKDQQQNEDAPSKDASPEKKDNNKAAPAKEDKREPTQEEISAMAMAMMKLIIQNMQDTPGESPQGKPKDKAQGNRKSPAASDKKPAAQTGSKQEARKKEGGKKPEDKKATEGKAPKTPPSPGKASSPAAEKQETPNRAQENEKPRENKPAPAQPAQGPKANEANGAEGEGKPRKQILPAGKRIGSGQSKLDLDDW